MSIVGLLFIFIIGIGCGWRFDARRYEHNASDHLLTFIIWLGAVNILISLLVFMGEDGRIPTIDSIKSDILEPIGAFAIGVSVGAAIHRLKENLR